MSLISLKKKMRQLVVFSLIVWRNCLFVKFLPVVQQVIGGGGGGGEAPWATRSIA